MSERATPESLRAWGRDYDGSPIAEGGDPMPGFTVGHLYEAANRIEELERENFALSANQCKAGYSGEHGDHMCRYVDALKDAARLVEPIGDEPCPGCVYKGDGCDCPQGGSVGAWISRWGLAKAIRALIDNASGEASAGKQ